MTRPLSFEAGLDTAARRLADGLEDGVRLVAIDGHSAAGKSTFAAALAVRTDAALISGDDFYRVMPESARARLSAWEGIEHYFD
jgi:cytidylate kinase